MIQQKDPGPPSTITVEPANMPENPVCLEISYEAEACGIHSYVVDIELLHTCTLHIKNFSTDYFNGIYTFPTILSTLSSTNSEFYFLY